MFVLILPFFFALTTCQVRVRISNGFLVGTSSHDMNGKVFHSFLSIPFAKPPVGELRYKDPAPPENWSGVRNATKQPPPCFQKKFTGQFLGYEDCLYLNVHTRNISSIFLKAVMVYIHGGGFTEGTSSDYGPEFLITEDVVLVTINYRLGVMGFLNFDDPQADVPGNAGLKDQAMALRWVKREIKQFGGNPNKVTIFGDSAGACSVHLHVLSPMSQGLFQRAVSMSGTALNIWDNGIKNSGVLFAKKLGFIGDDPKEMLKFMQNADQSQLEYTMQNQSAIMPLHRPNVFGPTIEAKLSKRSFLPDTPRNLIRAGKFNKVPFMLGSTNNEGLFIDVVQYLLKNKTEPWPIERFIPYYLSEKLNPDQLEDLKKEFTKFYFSSNESKTAQINALTTDAYITNGLCETLMAHVQNQQPVYFYQFESDTKMNRFKRLHPITAKYHGAGHCDDVFYLLKDTNGPVVQKGSIEEKSIRLAVKLYTNFAKYGNPSPFKLVWNRMDLKRWNNINIRNDTLTTSHQKLIANFRFWCNVYKKYRSPVNHFCLY